MALVGLETVEGGAAAAEAASFVVFRFAVGTGGGRSPDGMLVGDAVNLLLHGGNHTSVPARCGAGGGS